MNCVACNHPIDPERLEALPRTTTCVRCSTEKRSYAFMEYGHKTAGYIQVVKGDDREGLRRAIRAYKRAR